MKRLVGSCVIAFSMYSKIPMPRVKWSKENMKYALCFFPLVGVVIGLLMLFFYRILETAGFGMIFRSGLLVILPVALTGGIHLDGLLDTADALSSFKPMEEKLEILKDSHAGAFAIIVGICYFIILFGCYSELSFQMLTVLSVGFVLSRSFSSLSVVSFQMAKNTGLASTFSDMAVKRRVRIINIVCIVLSGMCMVLIHPFLGTVCFISAVMVFVYYRSMSYRKFGGITGDLAGFFLQICELVMAFCVAVAGKFI